MSLEAHQHTNQPTNQPIPLQKKLQHTQHTPPVQPSMASLNNKQTTAPSKAAVDEVAEVGRAEKFHARGRGAFWGIAAARVMKRGVRGRGNKLWAEGMHKERVQIDMGVS